MVIKTLPEQDDLVPNFTGASGFNRNFFDDHQELFYTPGLRSPGFGLSSCGQHQTHKLVDREASTLGSPNISQSTKLPQIYVGTVPPSGGGGGEGRVVLHNQEMLVGLANILHQLGLDNTKIFPTTTHQPLTAITIQEEQKLIAVPLPMVYKALE